ncbi:MAG: zinc-binding dehydrogenase [bacterium]
MKAIRYHGPKQPFRLEDMKRPEPQIGEVLVKITASGMCHTELHFKSGLLDLGVAPITMGHEVVGQIEAVGAGVKSERIGERVLVYYYAGCGQCHYCRVGDEQICPNLRAEYGFISDGGYAEYIAVSERNAVPVPGNISDIEAAPIGCGVTTAVHASKLADLRTGEWAVVYGIGGVGFGLVQLAQAKGAQTIAVSRTKKKLEKASQLGADYTIDASQVSVGERVKEITDGAGADVVFECVGTVETMKEASTSLGRRGRLVFIGYSEDSFIVHPVQLIVFEQQVLGSVGATLDDLHEAIDLVKRGVVRTVIDRTLPLLQFENGLQALEQGKIVGKVVLIPGA